jgi:hypothetical protein
MFKTTFILMLSGALAGVFIAAWIVPPTLAWYSAPGGLPQGAQVQAVVQIPEVIRYSTDKLIRWQAIAAAIGASGGLALGVFFALNKRQRRGDVAATSASTIPQEIRSSEERRQDS